MRRARGPFWLLPGSGFPPAELAGPEGLLAVGGDLTVAALLEAYRGGIFPWPDADPATPMLWFSPDPRFVLYPEELHVPRSLEQRVRSGRFEVRLDEGFDAVVAACARAPRAEGGTWITPELAVAFGALHRAGHAHCAASLRDGELVGGLYGLALGRVFFGESMFATSSDASKVAFVRLARQLCAWGFRLIDCQQETEHLARFGARPVPRARFLREMRAAVVQPGRPGPWRLEETP